MTKDEILDALEDEREKMLAALDGLSDEEMLDPTVADSWSVKDIIAHLNAWEAELVRMLWQLLQGSKPSTVQLSGESIDERNAQWQALYKNRPLEAVLEDYQAVRQQTLRRVDQFSEAELNNPAKYPALRGIPLWKWIAEDSFEHEAEHLSDIIRWKDQRTPRDSAGPVDR